MRRAMSFVAGLALWCGCACATAPHGVGEAPVTADVAEVLAAAVASGAPTLREAVLEALDSRPAEVAEYLRTGAPLHVLLAVGGEMPRDQLEALLDPARRLLVEEGRFVHEYRPPASVAKPGRKRPRKPPTPTDPSLDDLHERLAVPDDVIAAATEIVLRTAEPGDHGRAHSEILLFHLVRATEARSRDDLVTAMLARGLLTEIEPERLILMIDTRLITLVAAALRLSPSSPSVRELAVRLGEPRWASLGDAALATELERWWSDEEPYLYVELDALGLAGGSGEPSDSGSWIGVDTWAMFTGAAAADRTAEVPDAWLDLPYGKRLSEARASLAERRTAPDAWPVWLAGRRAALGLQDGAPR